IEAHFHFFVMVVVVSLYQSWLPFLLALGFVTLHHGIAGAVDPASVFNHPAALANPWKWALVHAFFILGQSVACLVAWRANEDALDRERAARKAMEQANLDLAEAQALAHVGSWDWDIPNGTVWWSEEMYNLAGIDPQRFTPSLESFLELVHPDDRFRVAAIIELACANHAEMDYECRIVRRDGATAILHALGRSVTAEDGSLAKMIGTCQDITERKALEQEIEHRALHDSLTGLGNRALFLDRAGHALAMRERSPAPLSVLFLDLDDFKTMNDSLGHGVGDELLVEVARRLLAAVRTADTVARLGGDEFAVLLENTGVEGAREIAGRIEDAMRAPVTLHGNKLSVRASIGIAPAESATRPLDVLRDADIAMYAAKRDGKGRCRVFNPDMRSSLVTRIHLQAELNDALARDQFVLHYQPVVDQRTGRLEAVEALVRWNHPERGLLLPADFIPVAEETGLIVPLGAWVTKEATRQAKALQDDLGGPLSVSVNLSPQQLSSDVVSMVHNALVESQLDPKDLVLEITETCLINQEDVIVTNLQALRALGLRVAIDDFGTGYSSLAYLRRLPIDILKIDRSFINCITDGPERAALTEAIIRLARILDLHTIAEGIETPGQAQALQDFGCHSAQGYYYCRPLAAEQLPDYLREQYRLSPLPARVQPGAVAVG
ncbi:MAG: putative bifunctional diguanylate cyclase/phosphodiesterase, partial [Egibacteraceae bacterium]